MGKATDDSRLGKRDEFLVLQDQQRLPDITGESGPGGRKEEVGHEGIYFNVIY